MKDIDRVCNRCNTIMANVSDASNEIKMRCPKCGAMKIETRGD